MTNQHPKKHYSPPSRIRHVAGWVAVVAGIAMVVLPGPGLLAIALGMILLGRHDPTLRRWAVRLRLFLRHMCHSRQRTVRSTGRFLRERHRQSRVFIHEELHRHASGKPFSPSVQIMIGFAVLMALVSLGAGAAALINS